MLRDPRLSFVSVGVRSKRTKTRKRIVAAKGSSKKRSVSDDEEDRSA